jgi:5'-3' exonuclease
MGIPYLNRYILDTCATGITEISFSELDGKVIVVDIMLYLYKFMSEDALMDHLYIMISLFRHYNIIPLFIFDGKPPKEKDELLKKRAEEKHCAENEYNELKQKMGFSNTYAERKKLENKMITLKKKCVRLNKYAINQAKELIDAYGMMHYTAEGEADPLCAQLVLKKYAYACLSEDMDQFIYGCPRILRYMNLTTESFCIYNLKKILKHLKLSHKEFKDICVLSGTDYNLSKKTNLFKTLKLFARYKHSKNADFYEWLQKNTTYVDDIDLLQNTMRLFDLNNINLTEIKKKNIKNSRPNWTIVQNILKPSGYIFLSK